MTHMHDNSSYGITKLIFDTFAIGGSIDWLENLKKVKIAILDDNYEVLASTRSQCKISCLVKLESADGFGLIQFHTCRMAFNNTIKSIQFDGAKTQIIWDKPFQYYIMQQLKLWKKEI
jgi:hypothetical protein